MESKKSGNKFDNQVFEVNFKLAARLLVSSCNSGILLVMSAFSGWVSL